MAVYTSETPLHAGDEIINENNEVVGNVVNISGSLNLCVVKLDFIKQPLSVNQQALCWQHAFQAA
ncbi:MAG: hypothetical protein IKG79_02955 [Neisseriaceae bacterium]|nr:hypothetical protein [Neisseriaceae bacterium]